MSYTKAQVLEELERCYNEYGEISAKILNNDDNFPSVPTVHKYVGDLSEVRESLNIEHSGSWKGEKLSESFLLEKLRYCHNKYGDTKTSTIRNADDVPSYSVYRKRFKSIKDAREKAGLERNCEKDTPNSINKPSKYSKEQLTEHLNKVFQECGNTITKTVDEFEGPSSQAYKSHFGSLQNARDVAGVPKEHKQPSEATKTFGRYVQYKSPDNVYIYVITVERQSDGVEYYYVGSSTNGYESFSNRLQSHARSFTASAPYLSSDGEEIMTRASVCNVSGEYKAKELVEVETYSTNLSGYELKSFAQNKEREKMLELAIKKETKMVLGGR